MESSSSSIIKDEDNSRESTPPPSSSVLINTKKDLNISLHHVSKRKFNLRSQVNVKETTEESVTCPECGLVFAKSGNRNKHLRNMHGIEPQLTPVEKIEKECLDCGILFPSISSYVLHRKDEHGSLFCPIPGCGWRGSSHKGLGRHAGERHSTNEKNFEWRKKEFDTREEFNRFILEMYEKGHLWYIRNGSNGGQIDKIEYRYCFREDRRMRGKVIKKVSRKRKRKGGQKNEEEKEKMKPPRTSGVEKSDACCTSYMRVRWRGDGGVMAEYCIDHLGHDNEVTSLPLLPEHKEEIREMMEMEDDPEVIVRSLRRKYEEIGGRLATVDEGDIREIMMEEVDPFGEMRMMKDEGEREIGRTACISMEFSPSPSLEEGGDSSSALLALLDEHNVRDDSTMTLGELVASAQSQSHEKATPKKKVPRFKLTDNGFVFRFDKNSVCGEKQFWRCEKKSECAARIHTDMKGTILKRINFHTHPANPDPDQVFLPKKKSRLSPSGHSLDQAEGSGLSYPPTLQGNSGSGEEQFDGGINRLLDAFVKEEDMLVLNKEEEAGAGQSEISTSMENENGLERAGIESEEFWRIFHLTKKVYAIVKKEVEKNEHLNGDDNLVDEEVMSFLNENGLSEFASKLRRYNKTDLMRLSIDECKDVIEDVAEGVRMFHAIRSEWGSSNSNGFSSHNGVEKPGPSHPSIKVYVSNADEMNSIYKMIILPEGKRSVDTFREGLTRRGLLNEGYSTTICVNEGRITVELCDEIMDEWKEDRVFKYRRNGEYLILEPSEEI